MKVEIIDKDIDLHRVTDWTSDYIWFIGKTDIVNMPENWEDILENNRADVIPIKFYGKDSEKCYQGLPMSLTSTKECFEKLDNPIQSKLISTKLVKKIFEDKKVWYPYQVNLALVLYAKTIDSELEFECYEKTIRNKNTDLYLENFDKSVKEFNRNCVSINEVFSNEDKIKLGIENYYEDNISKFLLIIGENESYKFLENLLVTNRLDSVLIFNTAMKMDSLNTNRLSLLKTIVEICIKNKLGFMSDSIESFSK